MKLFFNKFRTYAFDPLVCHSRVGGNPVVLLGYSDIVPLSMDMERWWFFIFSMSVHWIPAKSLGMTEGEKMKRVSLKNKKTLGRFKRLFL